ncbi:unnamed protein product [Darwinula stevensoni]|uniref:Uncharacterized protein n=1 Tax=Darwinula stevensoni TaxID=69355 RepID=A0A7R9FPD3_9CRUS|nr:unnamed protein product [Darwinula stevensoni]CAG0897808.1 unnamed protein product [Darwinula stevensoni]
MVEEMVMGKKVSIAQEVNGREADIQFEDEGETVGVGPVTVKFLQRFSGHGLNRSAYTDSSRLRKTVWLLVFVIASGYMVSGIIDVLTAFISGVKTTSTNDGLQLILTSRVANGFLLLIHPSGIQYDDEFEKGYEVNWGTISHVTTKKVVLQRLLPDEGGNCAPDTYLEKRFDMNIFDLEYIEETYSWSPNSVQMSRNEVLLLHFISWMAEAKRKNMSDNELKNRTFCLHPKSAISA